MKKMNLLALVFVLVTSIACKKQDEIDALNAQVAALEAQVSTIGGLEATIAALGTDVTSYEQLVATLNSTIVNNNTEITNLNTTIDSNNTQITNLNTLIDGLNLDVAANQVAITGLQGQVAALEAQAVLDNAEIASLNAQIVSLNADVSNGLTQIGTLDGTVSTLEGTNGTLTTQLADANTTIISLEGQLATANTTLNEYQSLLLGNMDELYTYRADFAVSLIATSHTSFSYIGQSTINPNVIIHQDNSSGLFFAINLENVDLNDYAGKNLYTSGWYENATDNGDGTYTFLVFVDYPNGWNNEPGQWTFEEQTLNIKDIEKATALRQEAKLNKVTNLLEMEYGFSESRAKEVTSVISNWKRLSKSREMTTEEANMFAMEVVGSDMASLEEAMINSALGDNSLLDELTNNAADLNGSSPEAISALIETLN